MPETKSPQSEQNEPVPGLLSPGQASGELPSAQLLRAASCALMGGLVGVLIDAVAPAARQRPDSGRSP